MRCAICPATSTCRINGGDLMSRLCGDNNVGEQSRKDEEIWNAFVSSRKPFVARNGGVHSLLLHLHRANCRHLFIVFMCGCHYLASYNPNLRFINKTCCYAISCEVLFLRVNPDYLAAQFKVPLAHFFLCTHSRTCVYGCLHKFRVRHSVALHTSSPPFRRSVNGSGQLLFRLRLYRTVQSEQTFPKIGQFTSGSTLKLLSGFVSVDNQNRKTT